MILCFFSYKLQKHRMAYEQELSGVYRVNMFVMWCERLHLTCCFLISYLECFSLTGCKQPPLSYFYTSCKPFFRTKTRFLLQIHPMSTYFYPWPVHLAVPCCGAQWQQSLAKQAHFVILLSRHFISNRRDLPVTSLSLQLSASSTTAAIMQNNLISHSLTSPTIAPIVRPGHRLRIKSRLAFLHVLPVSSPAPVLGTASCLIWFKSASSHKGEILLKHIHGNQIFPTKLSACSKWTRWLKEQEECKGMQPHSSNNVNTAGGERERQRKVVERHQRHHLESGLRVAGLWSDLDLLVVT